MGIWAPSNNASLGPPESTTQPASRLVQPFLHRSRQIVAILYNGPPLSVLKLPLSLRISTRMYHVIPWAHPRPQPKRHLDRYRGICTDDRSVSKFTMKRPFPLKLAPSQGWIWTPSNTWFLGPTRVLNTSGISIGLAVFTGLTSMTDRQTDQQTTLLGR